MTELVRWQPSHTPELSQPFFVPWRYVNGREGEWFSWRPSVDIYDAGDELLLQAELPGVNRDSIHIHLENNVLTLSGERPSMEAREGAGAYCSERRFGPFSRSFTLPAVVNREGIRAEYSDGVLTVHLPKVAEARPRRIEVHWA